MEWFDDELQTLIELKSQGLSWGEIADSLANKYAYRSYTSNACRNSWRRNAEPEEELEELVELPETQDEEIPIKETKELKDRAAWTNREMLMLHSLKAAGLSYPSIARTMRICGNRNYNENICQKKWTDTNWEAWLANWETSQEALKQQESERDEKQRIIEDTIAAHERLVKREETRTQIIIENIKSAIFRLPKPKNSDIHYPPPSKKYSSEHMGVMLSDLHVGAKYTLEETGGLGEYSVEIFKKRMNKLKESVLEIAARHRHIYEIPVLHVFCLGDIVAGMNDAGEWSACYIDLDIWDQTLCGFAALRDALATWSEHFSKIRFYGVPGNHGRVGQKGTHKHSSNWDRVAYSFVQESLREFTNIEFKIPATWWLYEEIQNHTFFLSHGDNIRGSMGIPYYGVERTQSRISGLLSKKPNYTLLGHFHSSNELSTNFGKVIMNSSFMGGDMYSLKELSRADRPEQKVFGIHHNKGITWNYNIHLED